MMKKNKPVNMATGGLMSMPPFIKDKADEKDKGITPYDVNTPKEARQGLPSRLVAPSRTRFNSGGFTEYQEFLLKSNGYKPSEVSSWKDKGADLLKTLTTGPVLKAKGGLMRKKYNTGGGLDLDGSGDTTMKDVLIGRGVIDADGNMISKNKKAYGGLMKRQKYNVGDEVAKLKTLKLPIDEIPEELEEAPAEGDIPGEANAVKDILINRQIEKLEARKEIINDIAEERNIDNQIAKLETQKTKVKAATGGLLKLSIGGEAGTSERYDRRRDYQAYAEGDMVEDESLMTPTGMNTEDMDGIAEANMEMEAEDNMDMGDMDGVVDTSALSEEEEKVVDDAVEMFPELEGIIPKIVATEFTEDGEVEGPGTGTSDSIPALLSDGEFVFTAKAVKSIGVDKLRKMMKDAEAAYDSGMQNQEADAAMAE